MDAKRDFHRDLRDSRSAHNQALISRVIANMHPGARLEFASEQDDRNGADVFVHLHRRVGIDLKLRAKDCMSYSKDDLCIEIETNGREGWALCPKPLTDRVVWIWADTARHYSCCAVELAAITRIKRKEWLQKYSQKPSCTTSHWGEYQTVCVYVPRSVVDRALAEYRAGQLTET